MERSSPLPIVVALLPDFRLVFDGLFTASFNILYVVD